MTHGIAARPDLTGNRILISALCINAFGAGMFAPFSILYVHDAASLSLSKIGLLLTIATLLTLAVTPLTGSLVDHFGARRLVVLSQLLEALGYLMYLFVDSSLSFFGTALLVTAGTRMFYTSSSTLIAEIAGPGNLERWYGLIGVTQSVASSTSAFIATVLIEATGLGGFRIAILGNAGCLFATGIAIASMRMRPQQPAGHPDSSQGYRAVLQDRAFLQIVGSNTLFILCSMLLGISLAVYATEGMGAPLWSVGVVSVFQTGLVVAFQAIVIRRARSHRRTRTMMTAESIWVIGCLFFAFGVAVPNTLIVPYLLATVIVFTAAQMYYIPTARSLAAELGPEQLQGRYIALYELSWGLAAATAPVFFGTLYDLAAPLPWLIMSLLLAVALLFLWHAEASIPEWKNHPAPASATSRQPARTQERIGS